MMIFTSTVELNDWFEKLLSNSAEIEIPPKIMDSSIFYAITDKLSSYSVLRKVLKKLWIKTNSTPQIILNA